MIQVDGVDMPAPTDYEIDDEEISKADRNAKGLMIKESIAFKIKLNLKWKMLTQSDMSKLRRVKHANFFKVSFIDLDGIRKTKTFYAGTLSAGKMIYKNGKVVYWDDVSMNLIER